MGFNIKERLKLIQCFMMISRLKSKVARLYSSLVYFILWSISYIYFFVFCNINIIGRENIPKRGRFIIASNHQNFFDGNLLANIFPPYRRVSFLISKRPLKLSFTRYLAKTIGLVLIGNSIEEYQRALKRLNNYLTHGGIVGIFPEGTVTGFSTPIKFKGGVAKLSLDSQSNVIPIYLSGTFNLRKLNYCLSRPTITVKIGKPIGLYNYTGICGNNLDKMAAILREKVLELAEPKQIEVTEDSKSLVDISKKQIESDLVSKNSSPLGTAIK